MKVEFELTIDAYGAPCISFKHQDKSGELEQKVLKIFIDAANSNGLHLINTGGFIGDSESYTNYEIKPIS